MYCQWECKLVQLLWKIFGSVNHIQSEDLNNLWSPKSHLQMDTQQKCMCAYVSWKIYARMLIAALFIKPLDWKLLRCSLKWNRKHTNIFTQELTGMTVDELQLHITWVNIITMLQDRRPPPKSTRCTLSFTEILQTSITNIWFWKSEQLFTCWGRNDRGHQEVQNSGMFCFLI